MAQAARWTTTRPDSGRTRVVEVTMYMAKTNPTVLDDRQRGFYELDFWYNEATKQIWMCTDNQERAADWAPLTYVSTHQGQVAMAQETHHLQTSTPLTSPMGQLTNMQGWPLITEE